MVSYIKKMLFVQVKKIDIFMLLKKHKYRAGLALYHDIVEHIQSKACINMGLCLFRTKKALRRINKIYKKKSCSIVAKKKVVLLSHIF